ncbi:MAG: ABC transporter ATP-binding protein [Rhodothermales bacterium]|nr:ABC transporter ATP-binding protein [Rhodothermales bacterium]
MIQVENINKSFDSVPVLKNVSLTVEEGETLAIIGRSGSGKSVLMKHLIGLLRPDSGRVLIDGTDINQISYEELRKVRRQFGVLFQGGALFDSMDSFDNVAFPLRTFTVMSEADIQTEVQACLDMVELPEVGDKYPDELSGGMRKRVALARAVSLRPRYILYDEPTSGLDPETSNKIDQLITDLADRLKVTSIVVTHDMHSVLDVADRAALVHDGTIHWVGTIDELHRSDDRILCQFVKANEYQIGRPNTIKID